MQFQRLAAIAIAALLASCATAPSPTFRWEPNQPFATFKAPRAVQQTQVDAVLNNTARADGMTMFVAANTAYGLGRVEDAGFLLYAATVRAATDLNRYPPAGGAGDSPVRYFNFLRANSAPLINNALTDDPTRYIAVAGRLAGWDCAVVSSYDPGWPYVRRNPDAPPCESVRDEMATPMQGIAQLLRDPDYVEAFQAVKAFNRLRRHERAAPAPQAERDAALARMVEIEKETGIRGFASAAE